jgi:hypothetical protein
MQRSVTSVTMASAPQTHGSGREQIRLLRRRTRHDHPSARAPCAARQPGRQRAGTDTGVVRRRRDRTADRRRGNIADVIHRSTQWAEMSGEHAEPHGPASGPFLGSSSSAGPNAKCPDQFLSLCPFNRHLPGGASNPFRCRAVAAPAATGEGNRRRRSDPSEIE